MGVLLEIVEAVSRRLKEVAGREVRVGVYSIRNSVSSFSLVGEIGGPKRIGADSPLKRSPKMRFGACALTGEVERELVVLVVVFSLGTYAASDLALECRTLLFLPNAAAAGCALDILESSLAPKAGLGGVTAREGEVM